MAFLDRILAIFYGDNNCRESRQVDDAHKYECRKLVQVPVFRATKDPPMEDHISQLPDEILSDILARLKLRDAARMSTLSRRWKNLRLPYLDLDWSVMLGFKASCKMFKSDNYKQQFIVCVDQVLRLYNDINITKFHVSFCYNKRYSTDVDKWIDFAAHKGLESLELKFACVYDRFSSLDLKRTEFYVICTSFLNRFRDLRNLSLDSCFLKIDGDLRFKRLIKLDLNYVVVDGAQWQWFLSEASSVEWLRLSCCNLPEKFCIAYNLCSLYFLMIDRCPDVREIEINSRNLKTLEFVGRVLVNFSSLKAPRLENVYVYLLDTRSCNPEYFLENLARHSPGLVTLLLTGTYSMIHKLPTQSGTLFRSVLRLSITLSEDPCYVTMRKILPRILEAFPMLQKLSVLLPSMMNYLNRHGFPEELPIDNFHVNLKEVELGGFETQWLFFAIYLLRSCPSLDQMVLDELGKCYSGCGSWCLVYGSEMRFGPDVQIDVALEGKAISPTARLIIKRES